MNKNRKFNGIDASLLFEELCEQILKRYLGEYGRTHLLGTSESATETGLSFPDRVQILCDSLSENVAYKDHNNGVKQPKDGGVDVVGWIPFADKCEGKPVFFCQCKTGTSYTLNKNHSSFDNGYFTRRLAVDPIPVYMVAELKRRDDWHNNVVLSGIFFDRLRLIEYLPPEDWNASVSIIYEKIKLWLNGAMEYLLNISIL